MTPLCHPTDCSDPRREENVHNADVPLDVLSTSTASESSTTTTRRSTQASTQASVARASASQSACPRSRPRAPRLAATSTTAVVTPDSPSARLPTLRSQPDALNVDETSSGVIASLDSVRTLTRHNVQPATAASRTALMSISQPSRPSSVSSVIDSPILQASAPPSQYSTAGLECLNSSFIQPPPEELLAENQDLRWHIASLENEHPEILQSHSRSSLSPSQLPSLPSPSKRSWSQPLAEPLLDHANPPMRTPASGFWHLAQNYGAAACIDEGYDCLQHLMREQDSQENNSAFGRRMGAARRERHALCQAASSDSRPVPAVDYPPAVLAQGDNPPSPDPLSSASSDDHSRSHSHTRSGTGPGTSADALVLCPTPNARMPVDSRDPLGIGRRSHELQEARMGSTHLHLPAPLQIPYAPAAHLGSMPSYTICSTPGWSLLSALLWPISCLLPWYHGPSRPIDFAAHSGLRHIPKEAIVAISSSALNVDFDLNNTASGPLWGLVLREPHTLLATPTSPHRDARTPSKQHNSLQQIPTPPYVTSLQTRCVLGTGGLHSNTTLPPTSKTRSVRQVHDFPSPTTPAPPKPHTPSPPSPPKPPLTMRGAIVRLSSTNLDTAFDIGAGTPIQHQRPPARLRKPTGRIWGHQKQRATGHAWSRQPTTLTLTNRPTRDEGCAIALLVDQSPRGTSTTTPAPHQTPTHTRSSATKYGGVSGTKGGVGKRARAAAPLQYSYALCKHKRTLNRTPTPISPTSPNPTTPSIHDRHGARASGLDHRRLFAVEATPPLATITMKTRKRECVGRR
ncbi:hypothetical protein BD410DRAFT_844979 [Rickenella mellea]|uniref:Uncharacterized protein n=1 Tax=Rickenella mellea TaxID=50990 RepID=A0A4Y7PJY3_9AGAM|nr:hypothetical protein BD410DRAFT_844979 [Rickenella mellea]